MGFSLLTVIPSDLEQHNSVNGPSKERAMLPPPPSFLISLRSLSRTRKKKGGREGGRWHHQKKNLWSSLIRERERLQCWA